MEKTIAILGSTGSIGTQTLEVVRENQDIRVAGLSAGSNITLLEKQIREFHPSLAAVWDEEQAKILAGKVRDLDVKVVSGMDGLLQLAQMEESQILVTAIVGMIGIRPTIAAIQAGKDIALANKETLVTAGHLIMPMAKEKGVQILPVDSEHSAIFQAIHGEDKREIHKLLITASGGPFRGMKASDLAHVKVEDALKHPNWAITFEEPDMETFLGLPMAMEASRRGGSMPTVFNAANERAVAKFLHGQIGFLDIYRSIREAMDRHQVIEHPCLEEILETEAKTYEWMESRWSV